MRVAERRGLAGRGRCLALVIASGAVSSRFDAAVTLVVAADRRTKTDLMAGCGERDLAHLDAREPTYVGAAARALIAQHLATAGASLYVGTGALPSVTATWRHAQVECSRGPSTATERPAELCSPSTSTGCTSGEPGSQQPRCSSSSRPARTFPALVRAGVAEQVAWPKRPSIPTAALFGAEAALPRDYRNLRHPVRPAAASSQWDGSTIERSVSPPSSRADWIITGRV